MWSAVLDRLAATVPVRDLAGAAERLSSTYRSSGTAEGALDHDPVSAIAYGVTRLPATYAATRSALAAGAGALGGWSPRTQLDLGTGCGAALLAAASLFATLELQVGIDRSRPMLELAHRLLAPAEPPGAQQTQPIGSRVELELSELGSLASRQDPLEPPSFDLVTLAYVIGEQSLDERSASLRSAWQSTSGVLVVVEPGTPTGFSTILAVRDELIPLGASVAAPCPHDRACPLREPDWCHFAARVARSPLQRRLKGGTLGHEDEKFSYVVLARHAAGPPGQERPSRVIRHPWHARHRVDVTLCTEAGVVAERVGRSDPRYRVLSRARWGDSLPARGTGL